MRGKGRLSESEYEAKVEAAGQKFTDLAARLQKAKSLPELANGLELGEKTLRRVAHELEA